MSRTRELGRSIGSTLASQAFGVIISLVFLAYFGRKLPKEEMALFAFMTTLTMWIELVSNLGTATVTIREVPGLMVEGKRQHACRLISSTLFYSTVIGVLAAIVLAFLAPVLSRSAFGTDQYVGPFRLMAAIALVANMSSMASLMQWALQRFHYRAICDVINMFGARILAVVGYLTIGIEGFLLAFGVGSLLSLLVQLWTMRKELTRNILPVRELFHHSRDYLLVDVVRNLMMSMDRPVVGFFLGNAALADYHVAKKLFDLLARGAMIISAPIGAKLSELKMEGLAALQAYFQKSLFVMAILFIPAGFGVIGMGEDLLRVFVGGKYVSGSAILAAFGITSMVSATQLIWREAVWRLLSARYLLFNNLIFSGVAFSLYAVLIPAIGPTGVPLAAAAGYFAASLYSSHLLRRQLGLTVGLDPYIRSLMCGLFLWAAIWGVSWLGSSPWALVAVFFSAGIAYCVSVAILAPPDIRALISRMVVSIAGKGGLHLQAKV